MSDTPVTNNDSAEKAYAEAAGAVALQVKPAQPKRAAKAGKPAAAAPAAKTAESQPAAPVAAKSPPAEAPAPEKAAPASQAPAPEPAESPAISTTAEPLALPGLRKAAAAKAPAKVAARKPAKAAPAPAAAKIKAKKPVPAAKAAPRIVKPVAKATIKPRIAEKSKDTVMTKTTKTAKITDSIKSLASDAQEKAKSVIEKGSALIGETTEFTKGNVAAVVESGKILASGLQQIGSDAVADTKDVISTIQSDFKELASVKSPTELIEVQNGLLHRNFDRAVAYNSKASETFLKLANDMMAPISGRVSLAMQKVRKAA